MKLSVLIRNRNESNTLLQTLASIKRQLVNFEYEIILIDNESDDDSIAIAKRYNCKIYSIKRESFSYGYALNFGLSKCQGDYILILSAHLILLNEFFLQKIPNWFTSSDVAGLRFIIPDSNTSVLLQDGVKKLTYSSEKKFIENNWKKLLVNHCAAIKRAVWDHIQFNEEVNASEDKIWSIAVLKAGFSILYQVPLFYVYVKPFSVKEKVSRSAKEAVIKEKVTGQAYTSSSLIRLMGKGLKNALKQWKLQHAIYKSVKNHLR